MYRPKADSNPKEDSHLMFVLLQLNVLLLRIRVIEDCKLKKTVNFVVNSDR